MRVFGPQHPLHDRNHFLEELACLRVLSLGRVGVGVRLDLVGTLLFLLPFCAYVLYESLPYLHGSWRIGERSREAGGLPALYLLKAVIPVMAILLAVQGAAIVLRCIAILRRPEEA